MAAHQADIIKWQDAMRKAQQMAAENLSRVTQKQNDVTERALNDYDARIAAARALARSLQHNAQAPVDHSNAGNSPVSGLPSSPRRAAQAPGDGLSDGERLTATEQAIQLDELIKWVTRQHDIDPNKPR